MSVEQRESLERLREELTGEQRESMEEAHQAEMLQAQVLTSGRDQWLCLPSWNSLFFLLSFLPPIFIV